jgi:hypothetical protein
MWVLAGVGAILAGLFLMLRSLLPWLEAQRSGAVKTRGVRPQRIERTVDPERFKGLCRQRLSGALPGFALFMGGSFFTFMQLAAILTASAR